MLQVAARLVRLSGTLVLPQVFLIAIPSELTSPPPFLYQVAIRHAFPPSIDHTCEAREGSLRGHEEREPAEGSEFNNWHVIRPVMTSKWWGCQFVNVSVRSLMNFTFHFVVVEPCVASVWESRLASPQCPVSM